MRAGGDNDPMVFVGMAVSNLSLPFAGLRIIAPRHKTQRKKNCLINPTIRWLSGMNPSVGEDCVGVQRQVDQRAHRGLGDEPDRSARYLTWFQDLIS